MSNVSTLAALLGGAIRAAQRQDRVTVGQIQGSGVIVDGVSYVAEYAADVDKAAGKTVFVVVSDDGAVVISDR